ncbi:gas vesicle protein GvpN [Halobacteria archaeon AArc-dxtr1]|nr:gas vesicle protein GvpN [Halobacteria archaeon AArc-dxtr1]
MADDSSRKRKVRGTKIRSDRNQKRGRRAEKELRRKAAAAGERGGDAPLSAPEEVAPEPFVRTDEIESLVGRVGGWLDAELPVHLIGPTGSGKTSLALAAAADRGRPVVWINGDEAVDTEALVGAHAGGERYQEHDQFVSGVSKKTQIVRERWVDNPLSVAAREGATLVYNEFSRSDPVAHNVLLSVFEEGVLERPGKRGEDRTIDVHPEFRAILTSNDVEYAGVHQPQDALLDRVVGVHIEPYGAETEREIVAAHVDLPSGEVERIVAATQELRDQLDDLDVVIGTRAAITAAKGVAAFRNGDDEVADDVLADVFTDVLAPKAVGVEEGAGVGELRSRIESTL